MAGVFGREGCAWICPSVRGTALKDVGVGKGFGRGGGRERRPRPRLGSLVPGKGPARSRAGQCLCGGGREKDTCREEVVIAPDPPTGLSQAAFGEALGGLGGAIAKPCWGRGPGFVCVFFFVIIIVLVGGGGVPCLFRVRGSERSETRSPSVVVVRARESISFDKGSLTNARMIKVCSAIARLT